MKLFGGGKADHPMADLKEARRLLEALPVDDLARAAEELGHWMESVASAEGFRLEQRVQTLLLVDDAAASRVRRLAREYFAAARPSRFGENRLWTALHEYHRQAAGSFGRAVELLREAKRAEAAKAPLAALLVRALRSAGEWIKWMHVRYGPIDPAAWRILNAAYAFAEVHGVAQAKALPAPGAGGDSSPQLEFLKCAMLGASSPDGLLPLEIGIAQQVIAALAPRFALAGAPAPWLTHWTDLAQPMAPQRFVRAPQAAPGLRYFGAEAALGELEAHADRIRGYNEVAPELGLGAAHDPEVVLKVLEHLSVCWSPTPPERKAKRHAVKSRLAVAHGYEGVLAVLGAGGALDSGGRAAESWVVENVSTGGFGALVQPLKSDWLRVGALVALQPEGGSNWIVGRVRRVSKPAAQQARVGIETLARQPQLAQLSVSGAGAASERGIVLRDGAAAVGETKIALRPGVYAPVQNLESNQGGRRHVYLPQGLAERGEDYEIGRYRELVREG